MLTQRRERILNALINEYIAAAAPVASRTIVDRYHLDVSAATVRSELASLEADGYVTSPHTSAGRIPTDTGYRAFVDRLLDQEANVVSHESPAQASADQLRLDHEELFRLTCATLMESTRCLAVVIAPSTPHQVIRRFSFVSLSPRRTLVVLVCADGQVLSRRIEFSFEVVPDRLMRIEHLFNSVFVGRKPDELGTVSQHDLLESAHDRAAIDILAAVIELVSSINLNRLYHHGMTALLSQPEFKESDAAMPLISMIENGLALISLFSGLSSDALPTVRIGHENENEKLDGISLVAQQYIAGSANGVIAVVGPTRMDYAQAIPAVMHASQVFKEVL